MVVLRRPAARRLRARSPRGASDLSIGGLAVPRSVHIAALVAYSLATLVLTLPLALRLGDSLVATDQKRPR